MSEALHTGWQPRDEGSGRIKLQRVILCERENPLQVAYRHLLEHGAECLTCLSVDASGANRNLPCDEGERVHQVYLEARRTAVSRRAAERPSAPRTGPYGDRSR